MKRKDFYLFRHGETEYNRFGLRQGQGIDAGLNETGRLQAQKLAVYLEEKEIEVIYTSPLRRARQTAEIAAVRLCIAVISDERLLEGNFGAAEGLSKEEVKRRWPEIIDNWYKRVWRWHRDFRAERAKQPFNGGCSRLWPICWRSLNVLSAFLRTAPLCAFC